MQKIAAAKKLLLRIAAAQKIAAAGKRLQKIAAVKLHPQKIRHVDRQVVIKQKDLRMVVAIRRFFTLQEFSPKIPVE